MKAAFILLLTFLLNFSVSISAKVTCLALPASDLAINNIERIYQLQDAVDDCESLITLVPLIHELLSQQQFKQAQNYLVVAQDYGLNPSQQTEVVLLTAELYLAQDNICQVQQLANSRQTTKQAQQSIELLLNQYNQSHTISAKALSCIFSATRSIAKSRGLKRTKSINMVITFEDNSAELTLRGKAQVMQLSKSLAQLKLKNYQVNFVGHTDVRGMESYNMKLSQKRAEKVYQQVISNQPSLTNLITHFGKGEAEPKIIDQSEQAHQINRRVEVFLSKK